LWFFGNMNHLRVLVLWIINFEPMIIPPSLGSIPRRYFKWCLPIQNFSFNSSQFKYFSIFNVECVRWSIIHLRAIYNLRFSFFILVCFLSLVFVQSIDIFMKEFHCL
jgi:hypothetical protein